MDGLILFSHGSVLCGAGQTLFEHAARLCESGRFAAVEVGFMNYSAPTFAEAATKMASTGVKRIVVVPYFLVPGKFVTVDLPKHIEAARAKHPNLEFIIAEPIGYDSALAVALVELARGARKTGWRADLRRAADYCEADPQCPLYGTPRCPKVPAPPSMK